MRWQERWYVYGTRDFGIRKELVVARTPDLEDFAAWSFWDGSGWAGAPHMPVARSW